MIEEGGGPAGSASPPLSFEEALARLEAIVRELEGSDLSLEETLARYEEGSRLVRECTVRLEEAEQRIRILTAAREEGELPGRDGETGRREANPPRDGIAKSRNEGTASRRTGRLAPEEDPADGDDLPF
jgi:exodeoxyribonuclease VII small subunit